MPKQITYLFGAGASANRIPVVNSMHKRMNEVITFLTDCLNGRASLKNPLHTRADRADVLQEIIEDLQWLEGEAGDYFTIDTLAKKLYLTGNEVNLRKLKKSLILYFTLEQCLGIYIPDNGASSLVKPTLDKRYSSFIAAITRKTYPIAAPGEPRDTNLEFEMRRNIKILSWNYDVQFELSLKLFDQRILDAIKNRFQILPNRKSREEVNNMPIDIKRFGMVKLNGDATWDKFMQKDIPRSIFDTIGRDQWDTSLEEFLDAYKGSNIKKCEEIHFDNDSPIMNLNFAWETDKNFRYKYMGHSLNLEAAKYIAAQTEVLVVVGYSFPVFNREIDKLIFDKMENLEKIYIQDKHPDKIRSTMENAFEIFQYSRTPVQISEEVNVDQFVIPYEL